MASISVDPSFLTGLSLLTGDSNFSCEDGYSGHTGQVFYNFYIFEIDFHPLGHKKKLRKKSFKSSKVQLKLQICVNSRCKSTRFDSEFN